MSKEKNAKSQYAMLGVDAGKEGVRKAAALLNEESIFPGSFVIIMQDPFNDHRVVTIHTDGDGSKNIQRFLHYQETGDPQILAYMADDALGMNTGDIAASGFINGPWLISNNLNLNMEKGFKNDVFLPLLLKRFKELQALYEKWMFSNYPEPIWTCKTMRFGGGETADLPDQIRKDSVVFDLTVMAHENKSGIISGVEDGDLIFGFQSDGQAAWETEYNFGGMSNGYTLMRQCLMSKEYNKKYPLSNRDKNFYQGRFLVNDPFPGKPEFTVSQAMLSPTRQWAIVISILIKELKKNNALHLLHGITQNTGGGAHKIKHLGQGMLYIKHMPPAPSLFGLIREKSEETWENMYESFNCGIGIDIVAKDDPRFHEALQKTAEIVQLKFYGLGHVRAYGGENRVNLLTDYGTFTA